MAWGLLSIYYMGEGKLQVCTILAMVTMTSFPALAQSLDTGSSAIVRGSEEAGHDATVMISDFAATCSGTVISEHVVLTARHCLTNVKTGEVYDPTLMTMHSGTSPTDAGITVLESVWHDNADIGLVKLAAPAGVTPAPLIERPAEEYIGTNLTLVGYGLTDVTGLTGTKHSGAASILDVQNSTNGYGKVITISPGADEQATCNGDSGGSGYVLDGADYKLAGVISFGPKDDCTKLNAFQGSVSVADYLVWIIQNVQAMDASGYPYENPHYDRQASEPPTEVVGGCNGSGPVPALLIVLLIAFMGPTVTSMLKS